MRRDVYALVLKKLSCLFTFSAARKNFRTQMADICRFFYFIEKSFLECSCSRNRINTLNCSFDSVEKKSFIPILQNILLFFMYFWREYLENEPCYISTTPALLMEQKSSSPDLI